MKKLDQRFHKAAKVMDLISQGILFALMCFFMIYIILRFFGYAIYGTVEIAQYSCLFIVVFGLARNDYKGGNIEITVLRDALPKIGQRIMNIGSQLFTLAVCGVSLAGLIKFTLNKYSSGALSAVLEIPVWIMALLVAVGFVILVLSSLFRLIQFCGDYTNEATIEDAESGAETGC